MPSLGYFIPHSLPIVSQFSLNPLEVFECSQLLYPVLLAWVEYLS